jgi:hypothetical protein
MRNKRVAVERDMPAALANLEPCGYTIYHLATIHDNQRNLPSKLSRAVDTKPFLRLKGLVARRHGQLRKRCVGHRLIII